MANDVGRQGSEMWGRVDEGKDAIGLADYLGRVTTLESVQAYKHRAYAALGVTEGAQVLDVGCGVGADVRAIANLSARPGESSDSTSPRGSWLKRDVSQSTTRWSSTDGGTPRPYHLPTTHSTQPGPSACSNISPSRRWPWERCDALRDLVAGWWCP